MKDYSHYITLVRWAQQVLTDTIGVVLPMVAITLIACTSTVATACVAYPDGEYEYTIEYLKKS